MSIQLGAVLHCYQPIRNMSDVAFIPLKLRLNDKAIGARNLIPHADGKEATDWNIREITPQCYEALAKGGVFKALAFNFGPTLLKDLWMHAPLVYDKIIESEKASTDRFEGHSNALAQASPNHAILPLAKNGDKLTHIRWALAEYEMHYKKRPEGVWLPETAVDEGTLALLADEGIKYTILSPTQAKQFRKIGSDDKSWQDAGWEGKNVDPSYAYKVHFKDEKYKNKNINVFFYDHKFQNNIAFPNGSDSWVYDRSENFLHRWFGARGDFKHFGIDGETFGWHQKGKASLLAGAVNIIDTKKKDWQSAEFMNYGLFLEKNPPQMEVQIYNNSSWSCDVELNRWGQLVREEKEQNGNKWLEDRYSLYGITHWHPSWRVQFRNALDSLNTSLKLVYEKNAPKYFKDPEKAALDYGLVVSNSRSFYEFFDLHKKPNADIDKAYKLLEMQKFMKYMFTSCGWFHEYVGRIEPFTNFICANSAIRIGREFEFESQAEIEEIFLNSLSPDMAQSYKRAKEENDKWSTKLDSLQPQPQIRTAA
ncbi:MAG: DUF3536 domain-containing protein [Candidatus Melainabacteria bacterium]|nr:DUF3536 domain-containing protein [Candidatus Melainabacteria bacterium]